MVRVRYYFFGSGSVRFFRFGFFAQPFVTIEIPRANLKELKILHDWVKEEVEFGGFRRKSRGRRRESPKIAREEERLGGEREKKGKK